MATRRRHIDSPMAQRFPVGSVFCDERTLSRKDGWERARRLLRDVKRDGDGRVQILGQSADELHE